MYFFIDHQLTWLQWIAERRHFPIDQMLLFLNFFDTPLFLFLLIPIIWVGYSWKWGARLFYLVWCSSVMNMVLKYWVALPRPCVHMPKLAIVRCTGWSFPSGGAQISVVLAAFLAYSIKKPWAYKTGFFFALFVGISRFFLGVHYLTDVIGGYAVGAVISALFIYFHEKIERMVGQRPYLFTGLAVFTPCIFLSFAEKKTLVLLITFATVSIGLFLSIISSLYLPKPKNTCSFLTRSSIVSIGSIAILYFLPKINRNISSFQAATLLFSLSMWVSLFSTLTIRGFYAVFNYCRTTI